ncbi:MAG: Ribosomal RNA large subunit methyltransferase L [Syntrophus sp. SKADARSKE-3]|nr:Ribosomal RNA large subunit methyltransferase L [Syntrophus sp. SKADARSKE-3]
MKETVWTKKSTIFITAPKGLVPCLAEEVRQYGYPVRAELDAAVETEGTLTDTMDLNLRLRTAHRVLYLVKEGRAKSPAEFYGLLSTLSWEEWIAADGYLCVTSTADTEAIKDSQFVNVKAKDAIVDRIREKRGQRPDSGSDRTGAVVHIYWKEDKVRVFIDTSGEALSRRGYRKIPLQAPMQETLAAGVILSTGWKGDGPFVNPMCGSGTLAIEAVLIALNRAPGIQRSNFGFMHVMGYDAAVWKQWRLKVRAMEKKELSCPVIATDIRTEAVRAAQQNARTAGVDHLITFRRCPFEGTPVPEEKGIVILNPGYGERMGAAPELAITYRGIGDYFKSRCKGYRGYIFTGNFDLAKKVGLRTSRRMAFYNSDIECRLLEYELYEGSRKTPSHEQGEK